MNRSLQELRLLITRLSIALLAYPVCKIIFFLFNHRFFSDVSFLELLPMLFYGLRFDIAAVCLVNVPFVAFHIVPFGFARKKWYRKILKMLFLAVNSTAVLADCVDASYFEFTHKRTTADFFDLFGLGSDISTLLPHYVRDFWYVLLIWIALIAIINYLYDKTSGIGRMEGWKHAEVASSSLPAFQFLPRAVSWTILNTLLVGAMIIGFRGGLQLRPIMAINASEYVSAQHIPLVVNSTFSIMKSADLERLEEKKFFSEIELRGMIDPIHHPGSSPSASTIPPGQSTNVLIIILESFSKEYIGALSGKKTYTPFLDSLIKEGLVFDNAFANGKKSIEGIPAILAGIPSLMNESYITSTYCSNNFTSIANSLAEMGYSSAFFHGGTNGTMGFDAFAGAAGFDKYYGRKEYNNEKDYDGAWGIWDEEFFRYTEKKVSEMKEPFLASLFTLSSHHPYNIPGKYKKRFPPGDLPIHRSIEYSDYSLRKFFNAAAREKWFQHTLFILTADHTGPAADKFYSTGTGLFRVPILLYNPGAPLKGVDHTVAQHIDILPTVLNYLHYNRNFFAYGNDLLDTARFGYAINYLNDVYQLIEKDHLLQFDGSDPIGLFKYKTDSLQQEDLLGRDTATARQMVRKLEAIIQDHNYRMIHNQLTAETK